MFGALLYALARLLSVALPLHSCSATLAPYCSSSFPDIYGDRIVVPDVLLEGRYAIMR